MLKLREAEEKQRRARDAREKAEAEKAARAARKKALVDMNAHDTQEGVMDSLMEALRTGSAFSRPDQRRKRQTRIAGGKLIKSKRETTKYTNDSDFINRTRALHGKSIESYNNMGYRWFVIIIIVYRESITTSYKNKYSFLLFVFETTLKQDFFQGSFQL